jgi:hypothetical protein
MIDSFAEFAEPMDSPSKGILNNQYEYMDCVRVLLDLLKLFPQRSELLYDHMIKPNGHPIPYCW